MNIGLQKLSIGIANDVIGNYEMKNKHGNYGTWLRLLKSERKKVKRYLKSKNKWKL